MPSTSGAVDLAALKNKPATPAPAAPEFSLDDLTPEQQAALDALAEGAPEEPEAEAPKTQVVTGFVVFQTADGSWQAHGDLDVAATLAPARGPHPDDFLAASAVITKDITAGETAAQTIGLLQQQAVAAARAQQEAALRSQVGNLPNLRG